MGALAMGSDTADVDPEFSHTLTSGVEIKGAGTGVESGLVGFLTSGQAVDKDAWFNFDRVTFATGSATIDMANSESQLGNLVEIMNAYSNVRLKIGGYTDNTGRFQHEQGAFPTTRRSGHRCIGRQRDRLGSPGSRRLRITTSCGQRTIPRKAARKNRRMALRVLAVWVPMRTPPMVDWPKLLTTTKSFDEMTEAVRRPKHVYEEPLVLHVFQPNVANKPDGAVTSVALRVASIPPSECA
jgi:hypothetical protein